MLVLFYLALGFFMAMVIVQLVAGISLYFMDQKRLNKHSLALDIMKRSKKMTEYRMHPNEKHPNVKHRDELPHPVSHRSKNCRNVNSPLRNDEIINRHEPKPIRKDTYYDTLGDLMKFVSSSGKPMSLYLSFKHSLKTLHQAEVSKIKVKGVIDPRFDGTIKDLENHLQELYPETDIDVDYGRDGYSSARIVIATKQALPDEMRTSITEILTQRIQRYTIPIQLIHFRLYIADKDEPIGASFKYLYGQFNPDTFKMRNEQWKKFSVKCHALDHETHVIDITDPEMTTNLFKLDKRDFTDIYKRLLDAAFTTIEQESIRLPHLNKE